MGQQFLFLDEWVVKIGLLVNRSTDPILAKNPDPLANTFIIGGWVITVRITSNRPPRERKLLGNLSKKVALVKRFLLHF